MALLVRPPVGGHANGADEPEDQVGQVDPDGVLHGLDVAVALGVLVDVHLAKDAKDGAPQDEHDEAPGRDGGEAHDERDQVEQRGQRGEGADNDGVDLKAADEHLSLHCHMLGRGGARDQTYPFPIGVDMGLACPIEIFAIETDDDQSHHKLEKVQHREEHVAQSKTKEPHGESIWRGAVCGLFS